MKPRLLAAAAALLLSAGSGAAALHHHHHGRTTTGAAAVTLEGVVESLHTVSEPGPPRLVLKGNDGIRSTILLRRAWASLAANWSLLPGDTLSVLAYPSTVGERCYVALELRNVKTGATLRLPAAAAGDCRWDPSGCRR